MSLGADGGWMPLPTPPQRYCDPASLVLLCFFLPFLFFPLSLSHSSLRLLPLLLLPLFFLLCIFISFSFHMHCSLSRLFLIFLNSCSRSLFSNKVRQLARAPRGRGFSETKTKVGRSFFFFPRKNEPFHLSFSLRSKVKYSRIT